MNVPTSGRQPATIGYLTVLRDPQLGFTGGLLILSPTGRPLEFHCSTPLAPTRAQEILFGATLNSHICGELIATALLDAAKLKPTLLVLQDADAAPPDAAMPTLLLCESSQTEEPSERHSETPCLVVGGATLQRLDSSSTDSDQATQLLETLSAHVAPDEPFERVQEAVREAQRISRQEDEYRAAA